MDKERVDHQMYVAMEHHRAGRLAAAEEGYLRVLQHHPKHFNAMVNLGVLAHQVKKHDAAVQLLREALKINPHSGETYSNLAAAYRAMNQFGLAVGAARRAIHLKPDHSDAYFILGNSLTDLDCFDSALDAYEMAVKIDPNSSIAHTNLGGGYSDQGRYEQSITAHRRAIELNPHNASAHWNLALNLLLLGDARGWDEYEWRWKLPSFSVRTFAQPLWNGGPLNGKTILLYAEQGFGDAIQFVRYVPLVIAAGGQVILECPEALQRLFRCMPGVSQVIVAGQPLVDFDVHCPLLSLPLVLGLASRPFRRHPICGSIWI